MAIGPIDYSIDVGNAVGGALQGFQGGFSIANAMQQRQQQQQQQVAQQQAAAQMNADLYSVASNPNASGADYAGLMTRYPQLSENLKRSWDVLDSQQRQTKLDQAGQVYSALQSGKPDVAKNYLQGLADAAENSGNAKEFAGLQAMIRQIDIDPNAAKTSMGMALVSQAGPEKFSEAFGKFGAEQRAQDLAPEELKQKRAEATIKAEEAKTAPQKFLLELEQKGWDIKKTEEDIRSSKEGTRLRAMEVALGKERNDISRQELQQKIDDAREKQAEKLREKVSTAESAAASIDNLNSTVDRILKNPSLNDVVGAVEGRLPAITSDESADAIALIDQLGSQAFIAQIPQMKGTGALSEGEGKKLQASLQSISRVQSEKQLRYNLGEVQRLMEKARERLSKSTGMPLSGPDRPEAPKKSSEFGGRSAAPTQPGAQQRNVVVDF